MSLDRSVASMVPSYDSSVSPPTSRAMSGTKSGAKLDHSEEERKILLVICSAPFRYFVVRKETHHTIGVCKAKKYWNVFGI